MKETKFKGYFVTLCGKVWSSKRSGRFIKPKVDKGYHRVSLYHDKKRITISVHRLVAETYIENPKNKPQVNHKDGVKTNNSVDNLEWVTASENQIHAVHIGLSDTTPIECHYPNGIIQVFQSQNAAARYLNIDSGTINKCLKGHRKQTRGYKFKYYIQ